MKMQYILTIFLTLMSLKLISQSNQIFINDLNRLINLYPKECDTLLVLGNLYSTEKINFDKLTVHKLSNSTCKIDDNKINFGCIFGFAIENDSMTIIFEKPTENSLYMTRIMVINSKRNEFNAIFHINENDQIIAVSHFSFNNNKIIEHLTFNNPHIQTLDLNTIDLLILFELDYSDKFNNKFSRTRLLKHLKMEYL